MSSEYKILGQVYAGMTTIPGSGNGYNGEANPGSEELLPVTLYTVPAGTQTVISSIFVVNHDTVQRTFDAAIVPAGETLAVRHHVRWDYPVSAGDFEVIKSKFTLTAGDKVVVLPSAADKISFTAFGVEIA